MGEADNAKGLLNYLLENCLFAYSELCKINKELHQAMIPNSDDDVNYLGAMNRMIHDYLIVRVGGLFDKTENKIEGRIDEVVSFEKLFSKNKDFEKIKKQEIIKYIIEQRHNFVAHTNSEHVKNNFPTTNKICDSNLKELLENLQKLLKNQATRTS